MGKFSYLVYVGIILVLTNQKRLRERMLNNILYLVTNPLYVVPFFVGVRLNVDFDLAFDWLGFHKFLFCSLDFNF